MRHETLAGQPRIPTEVSAMTAVSQNVKPAYLKIANVWKAFGDFHALKDISLDISEGEFVCFLGPSGCGKTTLLRAIAGLDLQTRGSIRQGGRDVSTLPPSQRDYGIVFQSYALFPNLTIARNIAFGLENTKRPRAEIEARVTELLKLVGLPEQGNKYPAQLSGGQQQRIALARAIAISPGLLLLDEPLSALDAKVRTHLRHEIKELQRKLGVTTIMVTHDQEEALSMADRIVVMNHGVIEQIGTPTEIYRHPATLFVADFIGEANKFEARASNNAVGIGAASFSCAAHDFDDGTPVIAAIRPEDVIPHASGSLANGAANAIDVTISEMEFLGSFWRTRLHGHALGNETLIADFSTNAARRLSLVQGVALTVELPAERLLIYPRGA
ncbi:iron(III) transport system ATP-binding protein [Aminobacter aminovorans]|uniref:Spermidine/putrescine import ATP-binding protein PotA n=1 Tax=Aminobacter aminovorans TaxID=83263 RepID=A0A381IN01_AMIAI|nr:putative 2-aminoethylphosphonate ABC transporter ATP-binding protein [Aminobacter aminovorans]TCS24660.1 iron(III) transport system ATP-binding protein [Aminobacter aminovorans]SUY29265.1 Spermidine/putrescine import ATP-binding protein PotA [Aminobacter aminovorans]